MPNYVKFQRGSEQAYNNLAVKSQDTLYFVYDGNNAKTGKLYLGERLLTGVGQGTNVTSLAQLEDVLIKETPSAGSFLVYTNGKWADRSLESVAALIAAEKALGFEVDTNVFKLEPVAAGSLQKLELNGFSEASVGALAFKSSDGKLNWGTPQIITNLSGRLDDFNQSLNNFNSNLESVVAEKIASLNHLTFKKVENLEEAVDDNTVYLVPNPDVVVGNDYLEYLVIDGTPELLGNLNTGEVNLDGYATTEALQTVNSYVIEVEKKTDKIVSDFTTFANSVVGDITKLTNYNAETPQTIIDELNAINERLQWEEIPV